MIPSSTPTVPAKAGIQLGWTDGGLDQLCDTRVYAGRFSIGIPAFAGTTGFGRVG